MDFGFEAAGFRTRAAVEVDAVCCASLRANRPWPVLKRDVASISAEELLATARLGRQEADLLIGGPPCQPFSKLGYWARGDTARLRDPRAQTLSEYLRLVEGTLPRAFVLENVEGFAFSTKSEALERFLEEVERINHRNDTQYKPLWKVIRAADYGVPQIRDRLFIVASRDAKEFHFPEPTHGDDEARATARSIGFELEPYTTTWDALSDVRPGPGETLTVSGRWADLLPSIPEGSNYLFHTDRGNGLPLFGWRRRYWSFLLKLAKDKPSWTIPASPGPANGPFHWENRRLSQRELCRLQTFPEDVRLVGSHTDMQRQIGNAVPSLVTEVLGLAIRKQFLEERVPRRTLKLLRACVGEPPPAQEPADVPVKYLPLVGSDSPHPGTGRGRRATLWAVEPASPVVMTRAAS